jgi:hypothetical protein
LAAAGRGGDEGCRWTRRRNRSSMPAACHYPRPCTAPPSSPCAAAQSSFSPTPLGYRSVGGGSTAWPIDSRRRLRWGGCSPRGHKERRGNMPDPSSPTPFAIPWPSASMVVRGAPSAFVCRRRLGAVTHPARSRYRGNQPLLGCVSPMHYIVGDGQYRCGDESPVHTMHNSFCLFQMHFVVGVSISSPSIKTDPDPIFTRRVSFFDLRRGFDGGPNFSPAPKIWLEPPVLTSKMSQSGSHSLARVVHRDIVCPQDRHRNAALAKPLPLPSLSVPWRGASSAWI